MEILLLRGVCRCTCVPVGYPHWSGSLDRHVGQGCCWTRLPADGIGLAVGLRYCCGALQPADQLCFEGILCIRECFPIWTDLYEGCKMFVFEGQRAGRRRGDGHSLQTGKRQTDFAGNRCVP